MQSTFFINSKRENIYLVNIEQKYILPVHPYLHYLIQGKLFVGDIISAKDKEYYRKKILYYIKHGLISEASNIEKKEYSISEASIEESIANLKQLTFEVTEKCNLRCRYCYYGDIYTTGSKRTHKDISTQAGKNIIDYISEKQDSTLNKSLNNILYLGFYGGEPLMNTNFIVDVTKYANNKFARRTLRYSMTTNGTLLKKHIDLIISNNIKLLVSLDGDEKNNSYRVYKNGENSFNTIIDNIQTIKKEYPAFFEENVDFNAVLHNRNSVEEIYNFFKKKMGKKAEIGELNDSGISKAKISDFYTTYRNEEESLKSASKYENIESELFTKASSFRQALTFLFQYLGFVFKSYEDLLSKKSNERYLTTGTCLPFSKKMFVSADSKILPCEKVSHEYALGYIKNDGVYINTKEIADRYNRYYNTIYKLCKHCYQQQSCGQCIFFLENLNSTPKCNGFMNKDTFEDYLCSNISFIEKNAAEYNRMMQEVNLI